MSVPSSQSYSWILYHSLLCLWNSFAGIQIQVQIESGFGTFMFDLTHYAWSDYVLETNILSCIMKQIHMIILIESNRE
ncbi:hypothetical protein BDB01DRAFT_775775 [Pilobolus umbonatus]|nr:hypothetical protein BDB01DRAFT_775775 [Pilobolus umbonatus]